MHVSALPSSHLAARDQNIPSLSPTCQGYASSFLFLGFFLVFILFIYLAASGLSCSTLDLLIVVIC